MVQVLDNGWAQVRCSNGWEAWVDGRRLVDHAPPITPNRTLLVAGAVAVAVIFIAVVSSSGDNSGPTGGTNSSRTQLVSALDEPANAFDATKIRGVLEDGGDVATSGADAYVSDSEAAARIGVTMKAAGYDLGDVVVMELDADTKVLYVSVDDSSPLNELPEDKATSFLETLASSPVMAETGVTRLFLSFHSSDSKGPYTGSFTVTLSAMIDAIRNDANIEDLVALEVVRG